MVLSFFTIAACLSVATSVIRPDGHMIYAGQILQGLPFKAYYSVFGLVNLFLGIGLLLRRRWSYISFLAVSAYSVLLAGTNMLLTSEDTLVLTGWARTRTGNFYLLQAAIIVLTGLLVLWLLRYRGEFQRDSANPSLHRSRENAAR